MDKHIDQLLNTLEEKFINNIDQNFNLYLLEDISDAGETAELFDSEDWYLFYLTGALELKRLINQLLVDSLINKPYLLKAISIKRVIDEKLLQLTDNDYDLIHRDMNYEINSLEAFLQLNPDNVSTHFLDNLHLTLKDKKWIDCSIQDFKLQFEPSKTSIKIKWIGRQILLVGLIKHMINKQYLNYNFPKPYKVINKHFINHKGKPFKETSLSVNWSQVFTDGYIDETSFKFVEDSNKDENL